MNSNLYLNSNMFVCFRNRIEKKRKIERKTQTQSSTKPTRPTPSLFTARPKRVAAPLQRYPPAAQLRSARPSIPLTRPGPTAARDASTPAPPQRALGPLAPTPARRLHPLPHRARTSGALSTSRNARPSPRRDLRAASALDPHAEAGLPFLNKPWPSPAPHLPTQPPS